MLKLELVITYPWNGFLSAHRLSLLNQITFIITSRVSDLYKIRETYSRSGWFASPVPDEFIHPYING